MADGSHQVDAYTAFLEAKVELAPTAGFAADRPMPTHAWLKPHVALAVRWMLSGGRRAIFASFGLHKTVMQLWAVHVVLRWLGEDRVAHGVRGAGSARGLIVLPLGVRQEFFRDAAQLGLAVRFVQTTVECWGPGLYLTNYESVREGKVDLSGFDVVSLDEAACLRGMGGTKTFRVLAGALAAVPYRFVATATPSPNDYIELLAYAEVLGVMDIGQAKTRFFKRNSEKADELTLHPHKEREFWLWVASWALFITRPSDVLGPVGPDGRPADEGYDLPPVRLRWHEVMTAIGPDEEDGEGRPGTQRALFKDTAAISVQTQAREKRASLVARVTKMLEICAADPDAHRILWHDLNAEAELIARALPEAFVLTGAQIDAAKEERLIGFSDGYFQYLAAKPVMAGAGCNFQRHCAKAVFVGVGFKFHDFIQAYHRIVRFGQRQAVEVDVIYAESEREVRKQLEAKWQQHNEMVARMGEIVREYGLSSAAMADVLKRGMGVERVEAMGERWTGARPYHCNLAPDEPAWRLVNNDCVRELGRMADDSVDLIVTSIPFANLYEYSPNFADFGHTDDNDHFWAQMDFLIPELFRVLKPGRDICLHVKDRIVYNGMTGIGFETVEPFSDECRAAFRKHGFGLLGTITSITDVVRENNQTNRLGHSLQLRDGSRMGVGVPEQVILLRKPQSDRSRGFADVPVVKKRPDYVNNDGQRVAYDRERERNEGLKPVPGTGYSRARWQLDACSLWRSNGDRLLKPAEWVTDDNLGAAGKLWKELNLDTVYSFEQHVRIGEAFEAIGQLPAKFALLPPHSWHADVWTDVLQMRSLNTVAFQRAGEVHICPLPFDIVNRLIEQRSMPGEVVFDPFAGIGTVPYCALKLGRRGWGVELAPHYWVEAAKYLALAEEEGKPVPTLFGLLGDELAPCDVAPAAEVAA